MTKLLIADRDQNECTGIHWLISSYSLPFEQVMVASTITNLIQKIENKTPEIVIVELDMIPIELWGKFKQSVSRYVKDVFVMTTEATFERAMQAIEIQANDLWVKPISPTKIKQTLQKSLRVHHKKVLHKIENQQKNAEEITYHSLFMNDETASRGHHMMVLQTENRQNSQKLQFYLQNYEFKEEPIVLPLSDLTICVFPNDFDQLENEARRFLREYEDAQRAPLAIVIRMDMEKKQTIYEKYKQSKRVLELTFFKGYRQIIHYREEPSWISIEPFLTSEEQRQWIEMLNDLNKEKIKEWMYMEFLSIPTPYPEPGLLRTRLTSILAQIRRFMKIYYLEKGDIEQHYHQVFDSILYSPVLYRIVQDMLLFIFEVLDNVSDQKDLSRLDIVEQGILIIETHFSDATLSLEKVAAYVDRNPSYFSHLLTRKKGVSFRQLLSQIRIREAKRYLLETNESIQQIAERTGFTNANYFSRIFKELTSMTPTEYRDCKSSSG